MRILHLLSQTQPTGAEAYAITVANWMTDQGHEVFIISDKIHSKTRQTYVSLPVHPNSPHVRLRSTFFLRDFLKEHQIQVIHCHSRAASRLAYWATRGTSVAVVSTIHGRQPLSFSKKMFDVYGEKVLCICDNLVQKMTQKLGMNPRKIRLVGNPVTIRELPFVKDLNPELRIAWIGRFTGPKGERARDFIQKTLPSLLQHFPELHVDVIGGNPQLLGDATLDRIQDLQNRFQQRLRVQTHLDHFSDQIGHYHLILGAGRVAISSLIRGVPIYAIGEYCSEGLVTPATMTAAMASNFGDIGSDGRAVTPVDFEELTMKLTLLLNQKELVSQKDREQLRRIACQNYDEDLVCRKIFNTYQSAWFLKNHPRNIPVLMYHKVPDKDLQSPHRIFVSKQQFENHLKFFRTQGFMTLTFKDLAEFRSGKKDFSVFPKKPLILTFDDGYVDNLTNAAPLLKKYGMKAVIFLLADETVTANSWDASEEPKDNNEPLQPLMNSEQRKELLKYHYEIGSHGFRHQKITEMNAEEALHELQNSKIALEKQLGTDIITYAYTYGLTSPQAAALAEEAGYQFAVNTDSGGLHVEEDPFAIFRVNIFPEDGTPQLRKKTSSWYRRYFYLKRGR